MIDPGLKSAIEAAVNEIEGLRQHNQHLLGQMRIVTIFEAALGLGTSGGMMSQSHDIVTRLRRGLADEERRASAEGEGGAV